MLRPFKFYFIFLFILSLIGFRESHHFSGERSIASDCNEAVREIITSKMSEAVNPSRTEKENVLLKNYQYKNSLWKKILSVHDFDRFNEVEYFRLLEIYSNTGIALDSITPVTIEQKLALIEALQIKFTYFNNLPSVQDEIQKLNVYKLKKLQKLMSKFDLSKRMTRENLADFSSDFFLILKGPPLSLMDFFTKNNSARINERMLRVLQEDMLLHGLTGTLDRIPLKDFANKYQEAHFYIKRIMKWKVWRFLLLPYDLPWIDQIKISDELLEKILTDGLEKHSSELITELKGQNAIDQYERFRKAYRPVAFGVGFYYYYQKYQNKHEHDIDSNNEEAKKQFIDEFKKLSESLNTGDTTDRSEQEIKEEQFQRVLKNYRKTYNEDPTPAEYNELKKKIFGN
jgi:hypothetical protein